MMILLDLQTAIDQQVSLGLNSLYLNWWNLFYEKIKYSSNFSFLGSGKATIIKKQYFDNE